MTGNFKCTLFFGNTLPPPPDNSEFVFLSSAHQYSCHWLVVSSHRMRNGSAWMHWQSSGHLPIWLCSAWVHWQSSGHLPIWLCSAWVHWQSSGHLPIWLCSAWMHWQSSGHLPIWLCSCSTVRKVSFSCFLCARLPMWRTGCHLAVSSSGWRYSIFSYFFDWGVNGSYLRGVNGSYQSDRLGSYSACSSTKSVFAVRCVSWCIYISAICF